MKLWSRNEVQNTCSTVGGLNRSPPTCTFEIHLFLPFHAGRWGEEEEEEEEEGEEDEEDEELDEDGGRFGPTDDFPDGIYHYVITLNINNN